MREGARQFAEQCNASEMRELVPLLRDLQFGVLTLGNVANHHDEARLACDFDRLR